MTETATAPPETPPISPAQNNEGFENYWGVQETKRWTLPDGKQWFEFTIMNEGAKTKFQKKTNRDLKIDRSGQSSVRFDPADERHTLIKESVTDWNMMQPDGEGGFVPMPFGSRSLDKWLEVAPPKIVEDLEFEIRKANPWLQAEMSSEEIDKEIERLEDMKKQVKEREAGEAASAIK